MKAIGKIAIALFLLAIVLVNLEGFYDMGIVFNVNNKASYVTRGNVNADILIHGPCEPLWMISPAQLDKHTGLRSYNLALSHSDFADNYLHLYLYLLNNKAPRLMFLYVTPESMDSLYNTFNTYRFAAFVGEPAVDSVLKECDPDFYRWTDIPFMKHAYFNSKLNFEALQGFKHFFTGREVPHFPDGYEPPIQIVWDNHLEEFMKLYPEGYRFKWNALREKYLRKTIRLAQENNIKVYLYESPVLKEAIKTQPNRQEIIERIRKLANEYGADFVQFEDMEIANSREYYMSPLNTNLKGSAIFNDSLAHFIKNECLK